jgi:hypothetical protein
VVESKQPQASRDRPTGHPTTSGKSPDAAGRASTEVDLEWLVFVHQSEFEVGRREKGPKQRFDSGPDEVIADIGRSRADETDLGHATPISA